MKFDRLKRALLTVGVPVSHYSAAKQPGPYIVWQEEGGGSSLFGDGCMQQQSLTGSLVYYTRTEYDSRVEAIQQALNEEDIAFFLAESGRDADTGWIYYSWVWELENGEI